MFHPWTNPTYQPSLVGAWGAWHFCLNKSRFIKPLLGCPCSFVAHNFGNLHRQIPRHSQPIKSWIVSQQSCSSYSAFPPTSYFPNLQFPEVFVCKLIPICCDPSMSCSIFFVEGNPKTFKTVLLSWSLEMTKAVSMELWKSCEYWEGRSNIN